MKKKILKLITYSLCLGFAISNTIEITPSALITEPELTLIRDGNDVSLSWATDILDSNLLWAINYNDSTQYSLNYWNAGNGGQRITSYLGRTALYTPSTNGTGNWISSGSTIANGTTNHVFYPKANKIPPSTNLSLSYRIASQGETSVHIFTDFVFGNSFTYYNNRTNAYYPAGSTQIGVDTVSGLKVGDYITFDTNASVQKQNAYISGIDAATRTLTLSEPTSEAIAYYTQLKCRPQRFAIDTPGVTFSNTNGYKLYNYNFLSLSNSDVDFTSIPSQLRQGWTSTKGAYITDLKIGYATKVVIYRKDNSARIYYGYNAEAKDTTAKDISKPKISINSSNLNKGNGTINFSAIDYGTNYSYELCGTDSAGNVITEWTTATTNVKSGIKEIRYKVTTNKSDTLNSGYTITNGNTINLSGITKTSYLLYAAVDNNGNISDIKVKIIDVTAPVSTIQLSEEGITKDPIIATITSTDANSYITKIISPDGVEHKNTTLSNTMTLDYTIEKNGDYTFQIFDSEGNIENKTITINNINADSVSMEISDNTINFIDTKDTPALTIKTTTTCPYSLSVIGTENFTTNNNDIILLENISFKINNGDYIQFIKNKNITIDNREAGSNIYNLTFKLDTNNLIGYKAGAYNSNLSFLIQTK